MENDLIILDKSDFKYNQTWGNNSKDDKQKNCLEMEEAESNESRHRF